MSAPEVTLSGFRRLKTRIPPSLRRPLGHVFRAAMRPVYYLRGKKILWDYTAHYRKSRRVYAASERLTGHPAVRSIPGFGLQILSSNDTDACIDLPHNYLELIKRIHNDVGSRFEQSRNCYFFPRVASDTIPDRTVDIPAVRNLEVITLQLRQYLDIDGLRDLSSAIVQELERKIYRSFVIVDKVFVYRTAVCVKPPQASWLWHYDNHPHEILKVLVYLTDVDEHSAPFEYLRSTESFQPVPGSPLAPLYGDSRVPESIVREHLQNGFECHKVVGPRGTMIIFDNNIIHKGNLAKATHRDVLVLQVRPAAFRARPCIDARWTGSFPHVAFSLRPAEVTPRVKSDLGHLM